MKEKLLWALLFIAIILGFVWEFYPLQDAEKRLATVPLNGDNFAGKNLPLTNLEKDYFQGVNVIKRKYTIDDQKYYIYVLDGTRNRHAIHDPTYCFKGDGWLIADKTDIPIEAGTAALYTLSRGKEKKEVLMWFSTGNKRFENPTQYWLDTTLRRLSLGYTGPEPVLIVIQPEQSQSVNWKDLFHTFPSILKI